jgi:O-antigen/teichoic acid export membrane protein
MSRAFFLATRYISLLTIPMGLGLALVAEPFILTFFTEKWVEAVPVVRGIAIYAMLLSVVHNTSSVYWAEGRPQILTWVGLGRLAMLFPALLWAVLYTQSIVMVGWMHAMIALLSALLNFYIATHLIGLSMLEIGRALRPAVLSGVAMSAAVILVMQTTQDFFAPWLLLTLSVFTGGIAYVVSLWFFQRDIMLAAVDKLLGAIRKD